MEKFKGMENTQLKTDWEEVHKAIINDIHLNQLYAYIAKVRSYEIPISIIDKDGTLETKWANNPLLESIEKQIELRIEQIKQQFKDGKV